MAVQPQPKTGCARKALLIFFALFGPTVIILGYVTNNPIFSVVLLAIAGYLLALLSAGIIEEVVEEGLGHVEGIAQKVVEISRWLIQTLNTSRAAYTILIIVVAMFLIIPRITPDIRSTVCIQPPLPLLCGNGMGVTAISVDNAGQLSTNGSLLNIGIIDEHTDEGNDAGSAVTSFDQYSATNASEITVEKLIFQQNRDANKVSHFTLAIATTLSRTLNDRSLSSTVGLENLKGAYLAQEVYNKDHPVKLRLIIANVGVKFAAKTTAPLIARQLVLYAKNAPATDHFIGVVGFPFSNTAGPAQEILQSHGIPIISPSASSDSLSNKPDFYRIELPDSRQAEQMGKFIVETFQSKHAIVLYDGNPKSDLYSNSLGNSIFNYLRNDPHSPKKGLGSENVDRLTYTVGDPGTLDQRIQAIVEGNFDLLFFAGYSDDLSALKDKLRDKLKSLELAGKPKIDLSSMHIMGAQALYELGGYTGNNYASIYFMTSALPEDQNPNVTFTSKRNPNEKVTFKQKYGEAFDPDDIRPNQYGFSRPGPDSVLAYDAVGAYLDAANEAVPGGVPLAQKVKDQLQIGIFFEGVTGSIDLNGSDSTNPSDPKNKPLYMACVNSVGSTKKLATYNTKESNDPSQLDKPIDLTVCK